MKKEREYTENQKKFLDVLMSEARGDFEIAKKLAGYSENTSVREIVISLREEIVDIAKNTIAMYGPKAAFEMADVMVNPSQSGASIKLKAAQEVLNRAGVQTKSEDVNINVPSGGILVLPAKDIPKEAE